MSRKWNRKNWKHSDSSDSDFDELMTLLRTLIFDFQLGHKISYDSVYNSDYDSITSENQSLGGFKPMVITCINIS